MNYILEVFSRNFLELIGLISEGQSQPWVMYWTPEICVKSISVNQLLYMVTVLLVMAHFSLHLISSHLPFPPILSCQMDI